MHSKHRNTSAFSLFICLLLLFGCSEKKVCNNRTDFVFSDDTFPIVEIDISKDSDSIRKELNTVLGYDLCQKCDMHYFRTLLQFEGKTDYINIAVDYMQDVCQCPPKCGISYTFSIMLNNTNQLLAEYNWVDLDTFYTMVKKYNKDQMDSGKRNEVHYTIIWDKKTDKRALSKVIEVLLKGYRNFIEEECKSKGIQFCTLNAKELKALKKQYQLIIEYDLGRFDYIHPPIE